MANTMQWETIEDVKQDSYEHDCYKRTEVAQISGGYLYRTTVIRTNVGCELATALVFVPSIESSKND